MNPQMNYTPQQVMGHDSYSVPCRVGNWAEDEYMGALLTADHMARSEKGMLMTQKLESTLGSALAPAAVRQAPEQTGSRRYIPARRTHL